MSIAMIRRGIVDSKTIVLSIEFSSKSEATISIKLACDSPMFKAIRKMTI